ncbi:G-protein coupled receptor GRL101-like protein [Leptotrombidium deliense]|uniref:G-protein coupled receptor GRL101-like protein n=1 Tax=Leptotrombidium deliense TaxID=299467 RepID=A0A443SDC4_9ACAR|nr:G-protein coupled receptor GRL101-like protein [Leptotrombidium deliense]
MIKRKTDEFRFCCLSPIDSECSPLPNELSSCEDLMSNLTLRISIWTLGLIALTGNFLVIAYRSVHRSSNKVNNYEQTHSGQLIHSFLIKNLAFGDLFMGVYLIAIAFVDIYYRGIYFIHDSIWRKSIWCQLLGFLSTLSSEVSVFTLTVITLERFSCIAFPFQCKRWTLKQTRIVMFTVWTFGVIVAGVPLLNIEYFEHFYGRSEVCLALPITNERPKGWQYSVFVFLVLNFISFSIISFAYFYMFVVVRSAHKAVSDNTSNIRKVQTSLAKKIFIIIMTDFCCWMPIIVLGTLSLNKIHIPSKVYAWIAVFVLPFNSAVNPILYTIATSNFLKRSKTNVFKLRVSFFSANGVEQRHCVHASLRDTSTSRTQKYKAKSFYGDDGFKDSSEIIPLQELLPATGRNDLTYKRLFRFKLLSYILKRSKT